MVILSEGIRPYRLRLRQAVHHYVTLSDLLGCFSLFPGTLHTDHRRRGLAMSWNPAKSFDHVWVESGEEPGLTLIVPK